MKDKDKKQTKHLSRFVRRSLLTLSALSLLSGVMPSSDTIRTGIGSVTLPGQCRRPETSSRMPDDR